MNTRDAREVADCPVNMRPEGWPASAGLAPGVVAGETPAAPTPVADIEEVADLARRHGEPFGRDRE